jgi:hypothetical protein
VKLPNPVHFDFIHMTVQNEDGSSWPIVEIRLWDHEGPTVEVPLDEHEPYYIICKMPDGQKLGMQIDPKDEETVH